jgi:hypothetical protein
MDPLVLPFLVMAVLVWILKRFFDENVRNEVKANRLQGPGNHLV